MSRSYEKFYCLHNWDLWGEQGRPSKEDPEQANRLAWTSYCKFGVWGWVIIPIYEEGPCVNLPPVPKERNQAFLPVSPNRGHKGKREGWGFKKLLAVKHKKWVRLFIVWFYFHHLDILYIWSWIFCIVWGRGCFLYFNLRISKWPSCVFLKESSFLHWSAVPHCHKSNICLFIGLFLYSLLLCHFVYSCTSITFSNSLQFSRSLCPTPCDPMNHSRPGLPVHHQLPEFTQIHVHWVGDAIQPSHPLSSPSPPALSLSQHQGLFKWVCSLHQVAKVLEFQLQHQAFQWKPRTDLL